MASNTIIQILRSYANTTPSALHDGEQAYSFVSNTLFIGDSAGGVFEIGGQKYTDIINAATNVATANTLVKRSANGSATFSTVYGQLGSPTGVIANTYGDTTHVPVISVAANGLITGVTTSEISSSLDIAGDSGSNTLSLITDTLTFTGGEGITTTVANNEVTFDVDDTVVRANTNMSYQLIDGDIQISGNLIVLGTQTLINTETFNVADPLIYLAANNYTSDLVDIGFVGNYFDGATQRHAGLFRHAGDKEFYIFDNYTVEPTSNVITPFADDFRLATLHANVVSNLVTSDLFLAATGSGGTNGYSFQGDGGYDTGMFSTADGYLSLYSNDKEIIQLFGTSTATLNVDTLLFGSGGNANEGNTAQIAWNGLDNGLKLYTRDGEQETISPLTDGNYLLLQSTNTAADASAGRSSLRWHDYAVSRYNQVDAQSDGVWIKSADWTGSGYQHYWNFGTDGAFTLPSGGTIIEATSPTGTGNTITLTPANGTDANQKLVIYPTIGGGEGNHLHLASGDLSVTSIFLGTDSQYVRTRSDGAMVIGTDDSVPDTSGLGNRWVFDADGVLTLPGSIVLANGTTITDSANSGLFIDTLNFGETSNVVFFNSTTGEVTYGALADVVSANAITKSGYTWSVDGTTGALYSDAGTYIADSGNSVILGQNVDLTNTNTNRVAIGNGAGQSNQGYGTTAIGEGAGNSNQANFSVALGLNAGNNNQSNSATAVGHGAGYNYQGSNALALGNISGKNNQGNYAVAAGSRAGYDHQGTYAVAMGYQAGYTYQGAGAVAIGDYAGNNYQSTDGIAIGTYAGENSSNNNGWAPIAIGRYAGKENAGSQSVAIGNNAGNNGLGYHAVAIGHYAANGGSNDYAIAIGDEAGYQGGLGAIAMGFESGSSSGNYSVAIGYEAGWNDSTPLGLYQIAIGAYAAQTYGANNAIVLNASGSDLSPQNSGFYVAPIRYVASTASDANIGLAVYNTSTKEVQYTTALDGGTF